MTHYRIQSILYSLFHLFHSLLAPDDSMTVCLLRLTVFLVQLVIAPPAVHDYLKKEILWTSLGRLVVVVIVVVLSRRWFVLALIIVVALLSLHLRPAIIGVLPW